MAESKLAISANGLEEEIKMTRQKNNYWGRGSEELPTPLPKDKPVNREVVCLLDPKQSPDPTGETVKE